MDAILRAVAVYVILLVLIRVSGKRTLAQVTTFDFVLILIIAETTQQALLGNDFSVTNMVLLSGTLIFLSQVLSIVAYYAPSVGKWIDGAPLVLVSEGEVLRDRLRREHVTLEDVLESARQKQGLERIEQVKYAVLEKSGDISIVPYD